MKTRFDLTKTMPGAYRALGALDHLVAEAGLEVNHGHLIKIRASQLNGCGYCVDSHMSEASQSFPQRKLNAISVWQESPFFDENEKLVLRLAEEVTQIAGRVSTKTYEAGVSAWGEDYVAVVLMAIISINSWNRVGVSLEMQPPA